MPTHIQKKKTPGTPFVALNQVALGGLKEMNTTSSNRQSKQRRLCRPRWRKVYHKITREPLSLSIVTSSEKTNLRPSPNERTRMGWHRRHAWDSFPGSRGTLRPETLNLEAWISCSGTHYSPLLICFPIKEEGKSHMLHHQFFGLTSIIRRAQKRCFAVKTLENVLVAKTTSYVLAVYPMY